MHEANSIKHNFCCSFRKKFSQYKQKDSYDTSAKKNLKKSTVSSTDERKFPKFFK